MANSFKLYKLIILYMLSKVDFPLTNSQISEFILDEGYILILNFSKQSLSFWNLDLSGKKQLTAEPSII